MNAEAAPIGFDRATQPGARYRLGTPLGTWIALAAGLLTLASWNGLEELVRRWATDEAYGHGFLMPAIIAFFVARDRHAIARTPFGHSWLAVGLLAAALAVFVVAEVGKIHQMVHYAYLVALCALVWATMGRASHYVLVPVSLLLFAIPLPVFTQSVLTADLQLLSSRLGSALLQSLSVPVYLDGNIIDLGSYQLHVAEACAGLNYLFPLLGIGHMCAYLFRAAMWKRVLLVVSTIPLTIAVNVARIASVGLLVRAYGPGAAEGFIHFFQGWAIFLLSTALLLGEMALLNRIGGRRMTIREMFDLRPQRAARVAPSSEGRAPRPVPATLKVSTILVALAAVVALAIERAPEAVPERTDLVLFPTFLGDWTGQRQRLDPGVEDALAADDYLSSTFVSPEIEQPVELFVAYYAAQKRGQRPHSPAVCLPGSGWEIDRIARSASLIPGQATLPFNRVVMRRGRQRLLAYYWFQQRGRTFANEYRMKWDLFAGSLTSRRRDGAMIRVLTPVGDGETVEGAERRLERFLADALPVLPRYVPD